LFSLFEMLCKLINKKVIVHISRRINRFVGSVLDPDPSLKDLRLVRTISTDTTVLARALESRYTAKCFFRSMLVAWILLVVATSPWAYCSSAPEIAQASRLCFWGGEAGFIIAYLSHRRSLNRFNEAVRLASHRHGRHSGILRHAV